MRTPPENPEHDAAAALAVPAEPFGAPLGGLEGLR